MNILEIETNPRPVVTTIEEDTRWSAESSGEEVGRVPPGPSAIAASAKYVYDLLLESGARAWPRMRAARIAAGPWREHAHVSKTWVVAEAQILAETLTDVVETIRRSVGPVERGADARPDNPFTHLVRGETKAPAVLVPLFPGGVCGAVTVAFLTDEDSTCAAYKRGIQLAPWFQRNFTVEAASQEPYWHAEIAYTIAHEMAHVWQFEHWRPRPERHSEGGGCDKYSPHGIRPWEVYANACGDAVWLLAAGYNSDVFSSARTRLVEKMSRPDSHWRQYWCEWVEPDFAAAHPEAAHAARAYHRLIRRVFPTFCAAFRPEPPRLAKGQS